MSLLGTINQSVSGLLAAQAGLQTVGNNIANANTPGYIRQELIQTTPPGTRHGNLILGSGVIAQSVVQVIDQALAQRMWQAGSDLSAGEVVHQAYGQLELLLGDLNGQGLSAELTALNEALHDLANEPASLAQREMVIERAAALGRKFNQAHAGIERMRAETDADIRTTVQEINQLTETIAQLNRRIADLEAGRASPSDATGLRDERYRAIESLAKLVDIQVREQENGSVSVFVGGDQLVAGDRSRLLETLQHRDRGVEVRYAASGAGFQASGGRLGGLVSVRDNLLADVGGHLNETAADLARLFNTIHAQGQGLAGFESVGGKSGLNPAGALADAGLDWAPENGAFDIHLVDDRGETIATHRIDVRTGSPSATTDPGTSLEMIVAALDAIDGLSSHIDFDGRLQIAADVPGVRFAFGQDTSGLVAAAGLNTFFVGSGAADLAVNPRLRAAPEMMAVSRHGIGRDTDTLTDLVDSIRQPLDRLGGRSLLQRYDRMISDLNHAYSSQRAATQGLRDYHGSLQGEHLAITGVNIDEEAIKMIGYQRAFQASSRVIATVNELLELLTRL